jgi:hypothetical protein
MLLASMLLAASCTRQSPRPATPAAGDSETGGSELVEGPGASMPISGDQLKSFLEKGSKLYWGLNQARTAEKTTIDENDMAAMDRGKFPTIEKVREYLRPMFTDHAIDTIISDFDIVERNGKVWMADEEGEDIGIYKDADIMESRSTADSLAAKVEVPLGDSGQNDILDVRMIRSKGGWKFDSDPYNGEDDADE